MDENKETQGQEVETPETEEKTYTQSELDALLQAETDRRVSAALKKQERKNQEKLKEAQKLATMNEQQKYEYELAQREAAIAEKEKELALAENKAEASKILAEKGLSPQLVEFVVAESAEDMASNISLLEKCFKQSVKEEVNKRLAGSAPKKGLPMDKSITKEDFRKMSYEELMELKTNQPELFDQLKNQ
jgi:hypothetical protein